jgi:hypothetical protein
VELSREDRLASPGLLYPLLVIAAIAVIVLSIAGMAAISGWMPRAMVAAPPSSTAAPEAAPVTERGRVAERNLVADTTQPRHALQCEECGVGDSVRELEHASTNASKTVSPSAPGSGPKGQGF